jgi:pyruvate dehydrogenase E2 component (dihydrolipoamide acetyltransferase)
MAEGKTLKWKIKPGDNFDIGDTLFSIETGKAAVDYQAAENSILAEITVNDNDTFPIGKEVPIVVKNKDLISQSADVEGKTQLATVTAVSAPETSTASA